MTSRPPELCGTQVIGLLAIVIAVDDLIVIHEAPGFGIHENVAIAVYVTAGVALTVIATPVMRRERLLLPFVAALGLLAASVAGDLLEFLVRDGDPVILAVAGNSEDIVKLLGFVAMAFLCERLAARLHGRVVQADNHGTP